MDSSITSNTNTSNNNFLFNTNLTEQQINKLQSFQKSQQTFSNILEAYISLAKELYFTQTVFNFVLALLAFAGNRPHFPASHENLYTLIMDCKDPESAKETNIGTIRKSVWRDLTQVNRWMQQSGITLFTRIIPKNINKKKKDASIYNISFLLYTLLEIIQEAYKIIHLHNNTLGLAIQAAAKIKAQELRQAATPQPIPEKPKKLNPKQKNTIQTINYHLIEAEKGLLKLKNELSQPKSLSNNQIADYMEQTLARFSNFYSNTILHLRGYQEPQEQNHQFCPTSLEHVFFKDIARTDSPTFSDQPTIANQALESEQTFFDTVNEIEISSSLADLDFQDRTQLECSEVIQENSLRQEASYSQEENPKFTITLFENHFEDVGTEATVSLEEFVDCIGMDNPIVITPKSDSKEDILAAKQKNKGFCPAIFVSDEEGRSNDNVDCLSMVCFDFDHADLKIDLPAILTLGFCAFLYTSYRHNNNNHRFRLGFLLDKPIDSKYYSLLWTKLFNILRREVGKEGTKIILNIDAGCHETSRLWYLPSIQNKNSEYFYKLFTKEDGYKLLNWGDFIADEIRLFDLGIEESDSFPSLQIQQQTSLVEQTVAEMYKKNVTLFSSKVKTYVNGTDKPFINGYYWPSYLRALEEKAGDVSLADSSWCFYCAKVGIPMEIAVLGLLEVSPKASARVHKSYGKGLYYHIETVRRSYEFFWRFEGKVSVYGKFEEV